MKYDIVIVGGGAVGLTAALALAKQSNFSIAVLDATELSPQKKADRVSAISLASQYIFQNLDVWDAIIHNPPGVYRKMYVWNDQSHLQFDAESISQSALGHIVADDLIRESLIESLGKYPQVHLVSPINLIAMQESEKHIDLIAENQNIFTASLVIAADGPHSWIRKQAGIALDTHDYNHHAIVATVKASLSHQQTARQRFLTTGPLAFLPLADENTCSIVWSTQPEDAYRLMELDDAGFMQRLAESFEHRLGEITEVGKRASFPLIMRHAKQYIRPRIALIGDAAHTIHPLAGLGLNLGLLDAACLTEAIITAKNKRRDFTSAATLRRYERWRKGDVVAMMRLVACLKQCFASQSTLVSKFRGAGMTVLNSLPSLKKYLITYATGERADLPTLAKPQRSYS